MRCNELHDTRVQNIYATLRFHGQEIEPLGGRSRLLAVKSLGPLIEPVEGNAVLFGEGVHGFTACFPSIDDEFCLLWSPTGLLQGLLERVMVSAFVSHFAPLD